MIWLGAKNQARHAVMGTHGASYGLLFLPVIMGYVSHATDQLGEYTPALK
jgi:hypothetical protein